MLAAVPRPTALPESEERSDRLLEFIHAGGGTFRRLRALLDEQVQPLGLVGAECLILWLCATRAHHAGWAQQDLATAVGVSPALMSNLVEGLRKRGLMEMKRSPIDRRRQVWQLLSQGEELLSEIRSRLGGIAAQIDDLIPPEEQQTTRRVFARLAESNTAGHSQLRAFNPDGLTGQQDPAALAQGGGK
jgi:DNA-binding MarR family transcriptional regulator